MSRNSGIHLALKYSEEARKKALEKNKYLRDQILKDARAIQRLESGIDDLTRKIEALDAQNMALKWSLSQLQKK